MNKRVCDWCFAEYVPEKGEEIFCPKCLEKAKNAPTLDKDKIFGTDQVLVLEEEPAGYDEEHDPNYIARVTLAYHEEMEKYHAYDDD